MVLTDSDFDLILKAIECASYGCAHCQDSTTYEAYDRILRKLTAYKKQKLKQRWGKLGI